MNVVGETGKTRFVRVLEHRSRLATDELVVDPFGREVHQREVVCPLVGPDVLRRDRVDVIPQVAGERLLVQHALLVGLGVGQPLEVVEGELRVDRDEPLDVDHGVYALPGLEAVLELVRVLRQPIAEQVAEQQLAEPTARLGGRSACSSFLRSLARARISAFA